MSVKRFSQYINESVKLEDYYQILLDEFDNINIVKTNGGFKIILSSLTDITLIDKAITDYREILNILEHLKGVLTTIKDDNNTVSFKLTYDQYNGVYILVKVESDANIIIDDKVNIEKLKSIIDGIFDCDCDITTSKAPSSLLTDELISIKNLSLNLDLNIEMDEPEKYIENDIEELNHKIPLLKFINIDNEIKVKLR